MKSFEELTKAILSFRDARDWKKFHNPKDMAISLSLEASELLELFQWKNQDEISRFVKSNKSKVSDELADVLYWVILISHDLEIDLPLAFERKLAENEKKYPIEKAKGNAKKYSELS